MTMKKGDPPVIVEQSFDASIEAVWNAITRLDQMHQWYFENIPSFRPRVGFETQFDVQSGDRHFLHMWRVTKVVAGQLIQYDWRYRDYPGDAFVVFELVPEENLTKLVLTCHIRESFPDDIPEFRRESCMAGWNYFIKDRLKKFVEDRD